MNKKNQRLKFPENYTLTAEDIKNIDGFPDLLNWLTDVVNSEPTYNIGLTQIGVSRQKVMVSIAKFDNPSSYTPVFCEVATGLSLKENRGIHMSRCIQSIFSLAKKNYTTLDDFAFELANLVRKEQATNDAYAEVTGTYIHQRLTRKTKLLSSDHVELISKASINKDSVSVKTGMKVYNATSCPCTKTYTKYSIVPALQKAGYTLPQIKEIINVTIAGSHMQIGPTILLIDKEQSDITHKQIYGVLENSLHLVYDLLKRPDEHDFVKTVLDRPQFTEDATREVAYNAYQTFKKRLSKKAEIFVKSVLQDSIHTHDVHSLIRTSFGEIESQLG